MLVAFLYLFDDRIPFFRQGAINHVGIVFAHHRHVRRNHNDFQFVGRMKLRRLGFRGTRHA